MPWERTVGRIAAVGLLLAVATPAQADVSPPANREPYNVFTVGDSYAAGEGAPQRDGVYDADGDSPNPREDWDTGLSESTTAGVNTERCHRSPLSTSGVATGYLAADFPDIQTVFRSVACSGGAIVAGAALDRDDPVNGNANDKAFPGGVLRSYSGEDFLENFDPRPATPRFDPQVNQIDDILAAGAPSFDRLDALIVGIGGNDAGFASYVSVCAGVPGDVFGVFNPFSAPSCHQDDDLIAFRNERLGRLPGLYDRLAGSLESNKLVDSDSELDMTADVDHRPRAVLLTAIPRVAHKADGLFCNSEPTGDESSKITATEAQFIENTVRVPLNQAMREAADDHGWELVDSHVDDFNGHAICQSGRWFNNNNDALRKQGELAASDPIPQDYSGGWVHPNARGYSQVGGALYRKLARQLVTRFTPIFTPRFFSENRADRMTLGTFFTDGLVLSRRSGNYTALKLLAVGADGANSPVAGADGFQLLPYSAPNETVYNRTGRYLVVGRSCAPLARNASIGCSPPGQLRISTVVPQTPVEVVARAASRSNLDGFGGVKVAWRHANPAAAHDTTFSRVQITGGGANTPLVDTFTVKGRRTALELGNVPIGFHSVTVQACNSSVGCSPPTAPASLSVGTITGFDPAAIRVRSYFCDRNPIGWGAPSRTLPARNGTDGTITLTDPDASITPTCINEPVGRLFIKPRRVRARPSRPVRLTVGWAHPSRWGELRTVSVRLRRGRRVVATLRSNFKRRTLALARGERSRGRRVRIPRRSRRTLRAGSVGVRVGRGTFRKPTRVARGVRLRLRLVLGRSLAGRRLSVEIGATGRNGVRQAFSRAGTVRVLRR